jgi:hypothetical protein
LERPISHLDNGPTQVEQDAAAEEKRKAQAGNDAARRAAEADLRAAAVEVAENEAAVRAAEERCAAAGRTYLSAQVRTRFTITSLIEAFGLVAEYNHKYNNLNIMK